MTASLRARVPIFGDFFVEARNRGTGGVPEARLTSWHHLFLEVGSRFQISGSVTGATVAAENWVIGVGQEPGSRPTLPVFWRGGPDSLSQVAQSPCLCSRYSLFGSLKAGKPAPEVARSQAHGPTPYFLATGARCPFFGAVAGTMT